MIVSVYNLEKFSPYAFNSPQIAVEILIKALLFV